MKFELSLLLLLIPSTRSYRMSANGQKISAFFQPASKKLKVTEGEVSQISGSMSNEKVIQSVTTTTTTTSSTTTSSSSTEMSVDNVLTSLIVQVDDGWKSRLEKQTTKPYFKSLETFVQSEMKSKTIFPPKTSIFNAFHLCPYDQVKVVIIGQDPYHGANQAHGLAFSVQKGIALPPSLRNMVAELKNDPETSIKTPTHGDLTCWSKQGVLLLNTCLTVRSGEANSHQKKGWEDFTDAVVKELASRTGVVYLLWGKPAQLK